MSEQLLSKGNTVASIEIAIDELGIGNDKVAYVKLPANKNDVIDALDRAKIYGKTFLRIEECGEVPELAGYEFSEEPTLDELNFLAERLEEIANDGDTMLSTQYKFLLFRERKFYALHQLFGR